ncbi:MAG: glycogen synthase [Flavobacterium sp.]|nr:glycogen synthase [Flavobacterium sp.]
MNIYHISAECYPVAKVGGLGDVVGALPKYQNQLGHLARVVVPAYNNAFFQKTAYEVVHEGKLKLGYFLFSYSILKEKTNQLGFELYQIAIPELFDRPNVYSYEDDTERFLSFQIAFLNWLTETNQLPDVLHCHDHHTGLIPFMVQHCFNYQNLKNTPTIITIHNGQYQGWFGYDKLHYLPQFDLYKIGYLEWNGTINPLASAIKCAWKVTTVSPSYLDEISNHANGLENLLRWERPKSLGILNGIDTQVWNTTTDELLYANYSLKDFKKGKAKNKAFLCEQFGLDESKPLFTFIGRLVGEKGADLLPQICSVALNQHPQEINILILGSGDPSVEKELESLRHFYGGNYNAYIGYNEKLAHILYAGADFLLMPSRVEPCGLNQMYALRYGNIPIVRRTGGLRDTVVDMGDGGFGICHNETSVFDVCHSISRAVELFYDTKKFDAMRKTIQQIDHSWDKVAEEYIEVYQSLKN